MAQRELFGERVDNLIPAAVACGLIYLFYGFAAALISAGAIFLITRLKPLQAAGLSERRLVLLATGGVLSFSIFFRSYFLGSYCSSASWAVEAEARQIGVALPCFIRGGYLQYFLEDSWRSVLRDMGMPIAGLTMIALVLIEKLRTAVLTVAGASALLALGLFANRPIFAWAEESTEPSDYTVDNEQSLYPGTGELDSRFSASEPATERSVASPVKVAEVHCDGAYSDVSFSNESGDGSGLYLEFSDGKLIVFNSWEGSVFVGKPPFQSQDGDGTRYQIAFDEFPDQTSDVQLTCAGKVLHIESPAWGPATLKKLSEDEAAELRL